MIIEIGNYSSNQLMRGTKMGGGGGEWEGGNGRRGRGKGGRGGERGGGRVRGGDTGRNI